MLRKWAVNEHQNLFIRSVSVVDQRVLSYEQRPKDDLIHRQEINGPLVPFSKAKII